MKYLCAFIFLSLLVGACTPNDILKPKNPSSRPNPEGEPFAIGMNIHMERDPHVAKVREMGASWVRIDINWNRIEPQPGVWDFAGTDRCIADACEQGLQIYATLAYSPPWASLGHRNTDVPDPAAWENFVEVVARRYQGEVQVYGIWNEPNLEEFWSGSAEQYTRVLLKPAYEAVKRIAPETRVAGPELAHLYSARLGIQSFLDTVQRCGGDSYIDIVSHHVYGMDDFKQKILGFRILDILYKPGLREMLVQAGLGEKEVWITEMGVDARAVGEKEQAQRLTAQLQFLKSQHWIQKAFIYELASAPHEGPHWGFIEPDGQLRPAFASVQNFIRNSP